MRNNKHKERVFVAGHLGMVGSAIVKALKKDDSIQVITRPRAELDLTNQAAVSEFFDEACIDAVYLAAAKVGGIHANNSFPAQFIYDNLMIESNVIHCAHQANVQRLLFLGSSCIYPKLAHQPIREKDLLQGELEPTNEPYAIAKIAGIKLCESYNRQFGRDYRSVMPTNLYGPNDNFHPENSHVIPALIRRIHEAKIDGQEEVVVWGTGKPKREFLHVSDMAAACMHVMNLSKDDYDKNTKPMCSHINVGTGEDCTIKELTLMIAKIVDYKGHIRFDSDKPDGPPRKLLDVSRLQAMGWKYSISLHDGLLETYQWFKDNVEKATSN